MNDQAIPRRVSRTALGVAMQRAVHQLLDGEPKILLDPVAARLLGADVRQIISSRLDQVRAPEVAGLRAHVVLRSRYTEDRLAEAVRRGVRQFVILGAGLDTFAYRQPEWAQSVRIFEVDHQGTQTDKRQRLQQAGIVIPDNLEFVAIDFESTSLREGLSASGLDFSKPTFFSCLGVLIYLTQEAVDAVFQLVAHFPAGSEIAFTFSTAASVSTDLAKKVSALGEPWQTHFEPEKLRQSLHALGFSEVSMPSIEECERSYFKGRSDGLHAPRRGSLAAAIVGGSE